MKNKLPTGYFKNYRKAELQREINNPYFKKNWSAAARYEMRKEVSRRRTIRRSYGLFDMPKRSMWRW